MTLTGLHTRESGSREIKKAGYMMLRTIRGAALAAASLVFIFAGSVAASGYVNLKYLASETHAEITVSDTSVFVQKDGKQAVIVFGYPFIETAGQTIRTDEAPFVKNGEVFLTAHTYDIIESVLGGRHKDTQAKYIPPEPGPSDSGAADEKPKAAAAARPGTKKFIIVIDPGHGGEDPGALGKYGLKEKDVVLAVGLRLKKLLKKEKNVTVLMTRDRDYFVTLKDRAIFANMKKADLFISLHCNSSVNRKVSGTRSYIYGRVASSREAEEAAKFENKRVNTFEMLLNDLRKSAYEHLSIEAAGYIQSSLVKKLKLKWTPTERAPFYVIANTNMPSTLIETAFISNKAEEKLLGSDEFRDSLAEGIYYGVLKYMDRMQ